MNLNDEALEALANLRAKLAPAVRKKRSVKREGPAAPVEVKPVEPTVNPNVRRNGPRSWLVMVPTVHVMAGLKSREDPVVHDSPITRAPYNVSHMDGNTARVCKDAEIFGRKK